MRSSPHPTQTVDRGQRLLDHLNAIRAVQSLAPIDSIPITGTAARDPKRCPVALATHASLGPTMTPPWDKFWTLQFPNAAITRMAGLALNQPFNEATRETLATGTIRTFAIAASYNLVFVDDNGNLRGWIDPTHRDKRSWNLHLMPGHEYPGGHEPAASPTSGLAVGLGLVTRARASVRLGCALKPH
jgi:hypothetical protein